MRRFVICACIILINHIIQSSLFQFIEINNIKPNSALIIIVSYAILRGDVEGAIFGFFAGLLQDIFFGRYIGLNALFYMHIGYFCGKPFKDFYFENYVIPLVLVLISSFAYDFLVYFTSYFFRGHLDYFFFFSRIILPGAVYNLFVCIPIYVMVYKINKRIEAKEKGS